MTLPFHGHIEPVVGQLRDQAQRKVSPGFHVFSNECEDLFLGRLVFDSVVLHDGGVARDVLDPKQPTPSGMKTQRHVARTIHQGFQVLGDLRTSGNGSLKVNIRHE